MPSKKEKLPKGACRVPTWWMECTPHFTLDLEEEEARRVAEQQLAFFYSQMAAADDAGMLGPDGKVLARSNGSNNSSYASNWNGRSQKVGSNEEGSGSSPKGRKFRGAVIDPKLFGIEESDPDYQSYLTGAKLPPGYLEKMAELQANGSGPWGTLNNTKSSLSSPNKQYGRLGEKPAFKPDWMKKKLRSSAHGQNIRQGKYGSPVKEKAAFQLPVLRSVERKSDIQSTENDSASDTKDAEATLAAKQEELVALSIDLDSQPNETPSSSLISENSLKNEPIKSPEGNDKSMKKPVVRRVRKVVRRKKVQPNEDSEGGNKDQANTNDKVMENRTINASPTSVSESVISKPEISSALSAQPSSSVAVNKSKEAAAALLVKKEVSKSKAQQYGFKDYYYNADEDPVSQAPQQKANAQEQKTYNEEQAQQRPTHESPVPEPATNIMEDNDVSDLQAILEAKRAELLKCTEEAEEAEYEDEAYDNECVDSSHSSQEDAAYEDSYVEASPTAPSEDAGINDLQAILEAKRAELLKLQASM